MSLRLGVDLGLMTLYSPSFFLQSRVLYFRFWASLGDLGLELIQAWSIFYYMRVNSVLHQFYDDAFT